jgi:hypothetical protein
VITDVTSSRKSHRRGFEEDCKYSNSAVARIIFEIVEGTGNRIERESLEKDSLES